MATIWKYGNISMATIPLIYQLMQSSAVSQAWFADDATAGGKLRSLRQWWDDLERVDPDYGYFVNSAKSWLTVKRSI